MRHHGVHFIQGTELGLYPDAGKAGRVGMDSSNDRQEVEQRVGGPCMGVGSAGIRALGHRGEALGDHLAPLTEEIQVLASQPSLVDGANEEELVGIAGERDSWAVVAGTGLGVDHRFHDAGLVGRGDRV